jgi:glycerate kinase
MIACFENARGISATNHAYEWNQDRHTALMEAASVLGLHIWREEKEIR